MVGQVHQLAELAGREFAQALYQLFGMVEEGWLRVQPGGRRRFQVETFCGRKHYQHKIP